MILSFIANMILARLLSPSDFGVIGMIMVFVYISNTFIDSGFGSALIQKKKISEEDSSTVFYWTILISIVFYFILYYVAPYIAEFYGVPNIKKLIRVLGLVLIINGVSITPLANLKKELNFKIPAHCFIVASLLAFVVAIVSAYNGLGVWSLVLYQMVQAGVNSLLLILYSHWYPKLLFSKESFISLFSYGSFIFFSSFIDTLYKQAQAFFIGKLYDAKILGYFTQAQNLQSAPVNVMYTVVGQVSFPIFAKMQEERNLLANKYININSIISFIVFPIITLFILLAKPIIIYILSSKWIPSIPFFQIICLSGLITPLTDITYFLIASIGRSKFLFYRSIILALIGIGLIGIGAIFGVYGIVWMVVLNSYLAYFSFYKIIRFEFAISFRRQIQSILPPLLISILSFLICYFFAFLMLDGLILWIGTIITLVLFLTIYWSLSRLFRVEGSVWLINYIRNKISRR